MNAPRVPRVEAMRIEDAPPIRIGPGCVRRDLPAIDGVRAWIVEMDAGATWPVVDRHPEGEDVYVIDGDLVDADGRYAAGSYLHFAPGSFHQPSTTGGVRLIGWNPVGDAPQASDPSQADEAVPRRGSAPQHRAQFDFEIAFANGGGLTGRDFRLDIGDDGINDDALAALLVRDLRLLMVATVTLRNKRILVEAHKRRG